MTTTDTTTPLPRCPAVWFYGKDGWEGRWPTLSGDEYGRRTLVIPLPGGRAMVVAFRICRCEDCHAIRDQTARHERVAADPRTPHMDELIDRALAKGEPGNRLPDAVGLTPSQYQAWVHGDGLPDGYQPPAGQAES